MKFVFPNRELEREVHKKAIELARHTTLSFQGILDDFIGTAQNAGYTEAMRLLDAAVAAVRPAAARPPRPLNLKTTVNVQQGFDAEAFRNAWEGMVKQGMISMNEAAARLNAFGFGRVPGPRFDETDDELRTMGLVDKKPAMRADQCVVWVTEDELEKFQREGFASTGLVTLGAEIFTYVAGWAFRVKTNELVITKPMNLTVFGEMLDRYLAPQARELFARCVLGEVPHLGAHLDARGWESDEL